MRAAVLMLLVACGTDSNGLEECIGGAGQRCEPICNGEIESMSTRACAAIADIDGADILCGNTDTIEGRTGCCFNADDGVVRFAECE